MLTTWFPPIGRITRQNTPDRIAQDPARPNPIDETTIAPSVIRSMFPHRRSRRSHRFRRESACDVSSAATSYPHIRPEAGARTQPYQTVVGIAIARE
jgi:hypothetical protein